MKKSVKIGLDIGVGSIGWAVSDIENNVIDGGVDLFTNVDKGNETPNSTRREFRSKRRQLKRLKYRLMQLRNYLIENNYIINEDDLKLTDVWKIRVEGFERLLTKVELSNILYSGLKRRGVRLDLLGGKSEYSIQLESTSSKLKEHQSIAHLVIDKLKKGEAIRNGENIFYHSDVVNDFENFFASQKTFGFNDENLEVLFFKLLKSKREYYEGPNKTTNSEQNSEFYRNFRDDDGKVNNRIWMESLIGKDKYNDELRSSKSSVFMEYIFTWDKLNNLKVNGEKLDDTDKKTLFNFVHGKKGNLTFKKIGELLELESPKFNYKFDKVTEKFIELKNQTNIRTIFDKIDKELFGQWIEEFDSIIDSDISKIKESKVERLTSGLQIIKNVEDIKLLLEELDIIQYEEIIIQKIGSFSGSYNFSLNTGIEIFDEIVNNGKNTVQALNNIERSSTEFKKKDLEFLTNKEVPNPVVRKSLNKCIQRIKYLEKKYNVVNYVVELARDLDTIGSSKQAKDKKKRYANIQKANETLNKAAIEFLENNNFKSNKKNRDLYKLYLEQDGCDAYSGEKLPPLSEIIKDRNNYEVDHIIPYSISFNDSMSNKVLTTKLSNNSGTGKGNKTPYMWLGEEKIKTLVPTWLKWYAGEKYNKFKNLVFDKDISRNSVKGEFINRNLSDTRYITREILNLINSYKRNVNSDNKVYAFPTTGIFTSLLRKSWYKDHLSDILSVDKRLDNRNHFIDAAIISLSRDVNFLSITTKNRKKVRDFLQNYKWDKDIVINNETGELIERSEVISDLKQIYKEIDFETKNIGCPNQLFGHQIEKIFANIIPSRSEIKKLNSELWDTMALSIGKEDTKFEGHKIKRIKLSELDATKAKKLLSAENNDTNIQIKALLNVNKDYFKKFNGKLFMNPKQTLLFIKNSDVFKNDYYNFEDSFKDSGLKLKSDNLNTPEIKKVRFDGGKATVLQIPVIKNGKEVELKSWTGIRSYGLEIYYDSDKKKYHGRELKRAYYIDVKDISKGFKEFYKNHYLNKKGAFSIIPSTWEYKFTLFPNSKVEFIYSDGNTYRGFYAKYKFGDAAIYINDYFTDEQIYKSFGQITKIKKIK